MTIKDFEKSISSKLVSKGLEYYGEECVDNLEKIAAGLWMAEVQGSDTYYTSVKTNRTQIKSWECDCPYNKGPICKHVIAVFYAIRSEMNRDKGPAAKSKKIKDKTSDIFKQVSKSDLEKFIIDQFRLNKVLKNAFVSHFAELLDEDSEQKYKTILRNSYKASQDRYGYIDYKSTKQLSSNLTQLVDKANQLIGKSDLMESLAISKALIEELPLILQNVDDSSGRIESLFAHATELFSEIIELAPPLMKDDLFGYCLGEYPKPKYHDFDLNEILLEKLSSLVSNSEQEKLFFQVIERQIEVLENDRFGSYHVVRLLKTKLDYLLEKGEKNEAQVLIEQNKQYPEFRKILVEQAVKYKNWKFSKVLCQEGIEMAKELRHPGVVTDWNNILLNIAELEGNIDEQRSLSKYLFYDNQHDMKYYEKLKSSYEKDEWRTICDEIIDEVKKSKGYNAANILGKIFIQENYTDRLMKLLEINAQHLHFVDSFMGYLPSRYHERIIEIYAKGIAVHAKSTSRSIYKEVAGYLKKMKVMKGGDERMKRIIETFRTQYKMRPAMMEILDKKFPETIVLKGKDLQKMIDKNLGLF